jgi:hypothetical protein
MTAMPLYRFEFWHANNLFDEMSKRIQVQIKNWHEGYVDVAGLSFFLNGGKSFAPIH